MSGSSRRGAFAPDRTGRWWFVGVVLAAVWTGAPGAIVREFAGEGAGRSASRGGAQAAEPGDRFRETIEPIFSKKCVSCHNSIDRKGELSLQRAAELRDSGYLAPGKPDESELLAAVTAHDGKRPSMPKSGEPLTAAELAALRDWIAAGAPWPEGRVVEEAAVDDRSWWSFQPLRKPTPPADDANPIDAFIKAKLREQGLAPSPAADRRTLVRRLTFDLIGLPPTPAETAAFVADDSPQAYERLVDRLLASPHYGERWARHWLDVVKYADTCGYDKDKLRPNAWPYRDYVIRAFNDDKPYARFVEEQIAGDVLYPGTADGVLGLGFVAAGPWDFIGHVEVPEAKIDGKVARHTDRDEMVGNTLNTFCSVTIQCCQCHHHKFDPFTQDHYYNLQSVFAAVDRADRPYDVDPQVERRRVELTARLKSARAVQAEVQAAIVREGGAELAAADRRIAELRPRATPAPKRPEFGYHSQIAAKDDVEKWVEVDLGRAVDVRRIVLRPCHDEFAGIGAGFGFPVRFTVLASAEPFDSAEKIAAARRIDRSQTDFANPGLSPVELPVEGLQARYVRVTAVKLAPRQNDYILALAELQVIDGEGRNVAQGAAVSALDSIEAPERWRKSNLTDGIWAAGADEQAVRQLAEASAARQAIVDRATTPDRSRALADAERTAAESERELNALPAGRMVYAAATQFAAQGGFQPTGGKPRPIHVLHRGNVLQPRGAATPGALPLLPAGPVEPASSGAGGASGAVDEQGRFLLGPEATEGDRRAALARWIVRSDNPLTWRSIVNRVWQHHFGRGLVDSPNDFGRMGKTPTHPELLDWMAVEFRDGGQSFKRLHKAIVMSATYRQASAHDEARAAVDSENRYLWRMNRRRLAAEEIRDAMLAVSGRLDPKMGGPGYFLFVLERPEHSPHYEYHKFNPDDPASHRRSIYRFIVRSQPDPYMTTLDCADSSQSTPQRNETLTSLQALSLLNNGFSLTMARHFAADLERAGGATAGERIERAFERTCGRSPTDDERKELTAYAERHGLANVCRLLFNLSEFVYVD